MDGPATAAPVSECSDVDWFDPQALPHDALPWLGRSLEKHLLQRVWLGQPL